MEALIEPSSEQRVAPVNSCRDLMLSGLRDIVRESEKIPIERLTGELVKGTKVITAIKPDLKQGYVPPPEKKHMLETALKADVPYKPVRYKSQDVEVPAMVPEKETVTMVPLAQILLFLHTDTATLLSKDKQDTTVRSAQEVLDAFSFVRDEMLKEGINGVRIAVFTKIKTITGTQIVPLLTESETEERMESTSDTEIEQMKAKIAFGFSEASKKTIEINQGLTKEQITPQELFDDRSPDFLRWLTEEFRVSPGELGQEKTGYFPAIQMVNISGSKVWYSTIRGGGI
jgi:hypothetical protein